ncbi:MAG: hypothetical protein PHV61_11770 [Limnochordia bacterium]|nr:hypothetical protein [Limnochordia bacterium]MDD2630821.1 hypothetical protein [Limnochordia bacterium]
MFIVDDEDVLRGLKKFKRLAKQDLLASSLTSDPEFWNEQAQARREMYDKLMLWIQEQGVDEAYRIARKEEASLPLVNSKDAAVLGKQQALNMFFTILGVQALEAE